MRWLPPTGRRSARTPQQTHSDTHGRTGRESKRCKTRRDTCTGSARAALVHTVGRDGCFPAIAPTEVREIEPRLPSALESLTRNQRVAVVLIHGLDWTEHEAAELLGVSRSTIRTHAERGLNRLRATLEVTIDA